MTGEAVCSRCHRHKVMPPKRVCRFCARRSRSGSSRLVRGNAAAVLERGYQFPVASSAFYTCPTTGAGERPSQPEPVGGPVEPAVVAHEQSAS